MYDVSMAAALTLSVVIQSGQVTAKQTVLRAVGFESDAESISVIIEVAGPLPIPRVGVLGDPPRVYLDFAGVTPTTTGIAGNADSVVRRVRVAVKEPDPVVTRLVIDLSRPSDHRVDVRERAAGRIRVLLGSSVLPDVPTGAGVAPKPAERPPSRNAAERAKLAVHDASARLEHLRPLLASIDSRVDVPEESLRDGISEFAAIKQMLTSVRPNDAQDVLIKVCVLGTRAAEARVDAQQHADAASAWNAASAAAGALMMLERAQKPAR
jgi:hypothetical protein